MPTAAENDASADFFLPEFILRFLPDRKSLQSLLDTRFFSRVRRLSARAQHRRQGKAGGPVEDEERVIHVLFIIAVEEAELLPAVGRVIGGIHVQDDDLPGAKMGL